MFGISTCSGSSSARVLPTSACDLGASTRRADYGILNGLVRHRANLPLVVQHWDDLLRLAGSLKLGLVQAGSLMRTLQTMDRPTRLDHGFREIGACGQSLYLLAYIDEENYRRRILTHLNCGESRHQLARTVFHGRRGALRQRFRGGQ